MYRRYILLILLIVIVTPLAFSYEPIGNFIYWNLAPSSNSTLGGVYAIECPAGELAYRLFENGTFACEVP